MDIRNFFNRPSKPGGKNGKKGGTTKQPAAVAAAAAPKRTTNSTTTTSKSTPKSKSKPASNNRKNKDSLSSPPTSSQSSSIASPSSRSKTTSSRNVKSPYFEGSNGKKKDEMAAIDSDATTDDNLDVVNNTSSMAAKGKQKKMEVDLDATTDEEMGDMSKKKIRKTTTKKKKVDDLEATTDEEMGDMNRKKSTTQTRREKIEDDLEATTDEDIREMKKVSGRKKVEDDLDATTDEDMVDDNRKRIRRRKKVEVDSDATTDDDMKMEKPAPVAKRKKAEVDLDATTDEDEDKGKVKPKRVRQVVKKKKVNVDLDATTDEDVDDRKMKAGSNKRGKFESDSDASIDNGLHASLDKRRKGRVEVSRKKKREFIDQSQSETDDGDDDDFELKPSRKTKGPSKRVHTQRSRSGLSNRSRSGSTKSKSLLSIDDDEDNDGDDDFIPDKDKDQDDSEDEHLQYDTDDDDAPTSPPPKKKTSSSRKPTAKPPKPKPKPKPKRSKPPPKKKPKREPPPKPTSPLPSYPHTSATPQCLSGYTFVFTGVMHDLPRDTAEEYVKILGGRVTSAVSGKTSYLVCGEILEDDRPVEDGSKFKKATALGEDVVCVLRGEEEFYGVVKLLDDRKRAEGGGDEDEDAESVVNTAHKNPYAKAKPANPYARPSNPYAKRNGAAVASGSSPSKRPRPSLDSNYGDKSDISQDPNALWADKYAPRSTHDILGNRESVNKLQRWLSSWEDVFNAPQPTGKKRSFGGPGPRKAALLSGPPGIGKTTTAILVGKESGRHVLEMNASDTRSKNSLQNDLGDVTGSQVLSFNPSRRGGGSNHAQKRCIIMDEVDGMGAGDRSGMSELIKMIKTSKVPIICICNDRQNQKMRSLVPYCLDLRYRRPVKTVIARRAVEIGSMEDMHVEQNAAEAIAESCGNDIRQVLNVMQMWANKKHKSSDRKADITYKDLKERNSHISKDEILRVSMFDATKLIVEGRRGLQDADPKTQVNSLFKRTDAFFTDYSLMGINVHQNYLKIVVAPFQKTRASGDMEEELKCLENMYEATRTMSDFDLAEDSLRSQQNWSLLPLCASLAVKIGHHAGGQNGGFLPGYPEFAGWLGKNSSRGRNARLLEELSHHMNYKVSADSTGLRLEYLPILRKKFLNLLMSGDANKVTEAIQFMDEYGLDRDDIFENLDELTLDSKGRKMADLDSKAKAAFTREYNKGCHKSQALIDEQGVSKKRKKADTNDEDGDNEDEDDKEVEESDDDDIESLQKLFKKGKGSRKKTSTNSRRSK